MILSMAYSISSCVRLIRRTIACIGLYGITITPGIAFEVGEVPALGEPLEQHERAAKPHFIFPNGAGLPAGHGDVKTGAQLYLQHCLLCHGANGRGGSGEELSGGLADLQRDPPDQTIGTYWPFATTLFDFIRRAMPMHIPGSLSDNQAYALTAYLLFENGILSEDAVLDADALKQVKMPNRDGFIWIDVDSDGNLKR